MRRIIVFLLFLLPLFSSSVIVKADDFFRSDSNYIMPVPERPVIEEDVVEEDVVKEVVEWIPRPYYPRFSLGTNALPWFATIPNINGEMRISGHFSLNLDLWWCPWKISDRYSLKVFAILPEGRWWLSTDEKGHFFGLHLTVAWFNLRYKNYRYQDASRPLLGAGLTYGYLFRFDDHWGLELSIGVGYMNMKYDRYYNIENGAIADTRKTSYIGPDRLGIGVVYRFD